MAKVWVQIKLRKTVVEEQTVVIPVDDTFGVDEGVRQFVRAHRAELFSNVTFERLPQTEYSIQRILDDLADLQILSRAVDDDEIIRIEN